MAQQAACSVLLCVIALCAVLPPATVTEAKSKSSAALLAAATPAAIAQQRALRRAISTASGLPVRFTLTTDIVLTAPLPAIEHRANVSITGRCKKPNGKPRSCIIDGAGSHTLFNGQTVCYIYLEGLIVQNIYGNVHLGGCSFYARFVTFRQNRGPDGTIIKAHDSQGDTYQFFRCDFIGNTALFGNGGVLNVGLISGAMSTSPSLSFTNCTFQNNRALRGDGGVIYVAGSTMLFRNVLFKGNTAASGGAVVAINTMFTFINTTFAANTANNGRGGAMVMRTDYYQSETYRFCHCTFRGNVAHPSRYRSSNNIAFFSKGIRASTAFCPGPVPGGVLAPNLISFVNNCTGCSGCDGDCYRNGRCVLDPIYGTPSCRCNGFFQSWSPHGSCTECLRGYTLQSRCTQCSSAYYHPKSRPATCALCPGLSKVLDVHMIGYINNFTSASGPLQCQQFCNETQKSFNQLGYCNMWAYMARRAGVPGACAGKCVMLSQSKVCTVSSIMKIMSYGITYQYLEPDQNYCDNEYD